MYSSPKNNFFRPTFQNRVVVISTFAHVRIRSFAAEPFHTSDRSRSTVDRLDPVPWSIVMIWCAGSAYYRSSPGTMYVLDHSDHTALTQQ